MLAQALIFLRFGCYVHNPNAIYTKARKPIMNWISQLQDDDSEWGYTTPSGPHSVISIDVPNNLRTALLEFEANYTYTDMSTRMVQAILTAQKNSFKLTTNNFKVFCRLTRTTPATLVDVLESYLSRIEVNPMQPVTPEELKAIKGLGVDWRLAARLPRVEAGDFEKIYIVDEHHRVKCL